MTIQPDDGYEQQRAALGRLYALMNDPDRDRFTTGEIHEALAGPETSSVPTDPEPDWYVHRQTRQPGMRYEEETAQNVKDWLDRVAPAGVKFWEEPDDPEFPGELELNTLHGPVLVRYGDRVMLNARGWPYPLTPEEFPLAFTQEH